MRGLKAILVSTYVILIILLLLSLLKCGGRTEPAKAGRDTDTIVIHERDTIILRDTVREEKDSIPKTEPEKRDTVVDGERIEIKETFKADVVFCIDCTGSMNSVIATIKNNIKNFTPDVKRLCIKKGKDVGDMRIKVIGFRDYCDRKAFEESAFYAVPAQQSALYGFLDKLVADGGGDEPEIGHDALAKAFKTSWHRGEDTHQIVILWTNAPSHKMKGTSSVGASVNTLNSLWMSNLNARGKCLLIFAPSDNSWTKLPSTLSNTKRYNDSSGSDYRIIIKALSEIM